MEGHVEKTIKTKQTTGGITLQKYDAAVYIDWR